MTNGIDITDISRIPAVQGASASDRARFEWHMGVADRLLAEGRDEDARGVLEDALSLLPPERVAA